MKKLLVLLVAAVVALCIVVPASAAPPQPTLVMTPTIPVVGDLVTFAGCGYPKNETRFEVLISGPDGILVYSPFTWAGTDANGCFSTAGAAPFVVPTVGTYFVDVFSAKQPNTDSTLTFVVSS